MRHLMPAVYFLALTALTMPVTHGMMALSPPPPPPPEITEPEPSPKPSDPGEKDEDRVSPSDEGDSDKSGEDKAPPTDPEKDVPTDGAFLSKRGDTAVARLVSPK